MYLYILYNTLYYIHIPIYSLPYVYICILYIHSMCCGQIRADRPECMFLVDTDNGGFRIR